MQTRAFLCSVIVQMCLVATTVGQPNATIEAGPISQAQLDAVRTARQRALEQPRRLIFNSDGNEPLLAAAPTREAFLEARLSGIVGTHVDTLFYCPFSTGISMFTHRTKIGELLASKEKQLRNNLTADFHANGLDPLQLAIDFAVEQKMPVFFSFRMNDTHDAVHKPDAPDPLYPRWKEERPDLMFGANQETMKYGKWSASDYGQAEVRERVYQLLEEACQNYAVQGLELDFFRHTQLFRRVAQTGTGATESELAQMTDLMRRIREMTEREAARRGGEPYLIAVRVPDSVEARRWLGIDLERWLEEGLIDIIVSTGYFQFHPWQTSVELGRRHGVKVYAGIEKSRIFPPKRMPETQRLRSRYEPLRHTQQAFRARAAEAWQSGVDGIYLFNEYKPAESPHLSEVGDPEALRGLDKLYFATYLGSKSANFWFPDATALFTRSTLEPGTPVTIAPDNASSVEIFIGDDLSTAANEQTPTATLCLQFEASLESTPIEVSLNGKRLTGTETRDDKLVVALAPNLLKLGSNKVDVALTGDAAKLIRLMDLQIAIDYPQDPTPWHELVTK